MSYPNNNNIKTPFQPNSPLTKDLKLASGGHDIPFHKQVIAGASAGLVEVLIMYPLDVVKTRLQLQKVK
jgi:hypothetical protein